MLNRRAMPSEIWSVFRDGKRVTVSSFFTERSAQRQLDAWIQREAAGGRPDVTTEGLYVDRVPTLLEQIRDLVGEDD